MAMIRRHWLGAAAGTVAGGILVPTARASARREAGGTFEVYQDASKEFRWRLKAANGQVVATGGQGYKAKADCLRGIEAVRELAATAKVDEPAAKS